MTEENENVPPDNTDGSVSIDVPDGYENKAYTPEYIMEDVPRKTEVNGNNVATESNGKVIDDGASSSSNNEGNDLRSQSVVSVSQLFRYASTTDWVFMFFASISACINGVLQPVSFIIFGELINDFVDEDSGKTIDLNKEMEKFGIYYVYIGLGAIVFGYFQNMLWLRASINQAFRIRTLAFESILKQDIGFFDTNDAGELSSRLADGVTKVQNGIGDKIGSLQHAIAMLVGGIIIGFIYGWKLTLVIIAMSPLLFIGAFATGKVIGMITSQEQTSYAKAGSIAEEVLSSIRTVVAFGSERKEIDRYRVNLKDAEKAGIRKGLSTGFAFALFNSTLFGCMALGFWYGGTLIGDGEINAGDLLIVFFSVMIGANQFGQVGPNIEAFSSARGAAYTIFKLIERKPVIDSLTDAGEKTKIEGDIKFVDCQFSYPSRPDIKILRGLNLNIKPGTTCALVGESGCGKSTTVKLIQRFYDAAGGRVQIDGVDIKRINVKHLRKHIGVVSQEPVLFDASIKKNILMGHPEATEDMVIEAAKNANAHDFISKLPQGYDTNVGEGGAQLSGGQKQRIAIARALVRDPKILLLDEATSALDTGSEAIVQAALDKASLGRTTVIIAHRLSTVKNADSIAVVSAGQVSELGSHKELMDKRGEYFKLVMLQNFEEQEEEELNSELGSVISESEREEIIARKMMRSLSQLSNTGSETDQQLVKELIDREITHRKSIRRVKSTVGTQKQVSKLDRQLSQTKEVKEEELPEDEPVQIPPISRILKLNAKEWPYIVTGIFFSAIAGTMPVLFAIILAEILQSFAENDPQEMEKKMEFWAIMFMVIGLVIGVAFFIAQYLFAKAGEALTTRLREMAFTSLLRQEIGYFDLPQHSTGALSARLSADASAVQGATSTRLNTLTQVVVTGLSSLIVAFAYSWQLSLLVLAFVPFIAMFGAIQTSLNTSFAGDAQKKLSQAGAISTEAIMQIRTVASLGKEDFFFDKYKSLLMGPTQGSRKGAHIYGIAYGFSIGVMLFSNGACFRLGGYLAERDGLSLSSIVKVIIGIQFGAMTAGQVASFAPDYVKAKTAAGRILALFDRKPAIDSYSTEGIKNEIKGDITFTDVEFTYPTRQNVPILQKLNIKIPRGRTVAFVGASGCGKSTSVSLLERFYEVAGGEVLIDDIPIKDYNIRALRSQIGIVQQEPVLFDRSIRDNILYGIEDPSQITQEQIEEACRNSNIHHVIMNLPNGYDTKVGDKGTLISGGQKQRIAIARALIRNPKIFDRRRRFLS
uniref:Uncharacterized protein n=1 Tax=Clytia hemisphaerica TaxID=252671 RepID=A0A7M5VBZ8_9CNID